MGNSNYDNWTWENQLDDYNPNEIKYSGEDMNEAYLAGNHYFEVNSNQIKELEEANTKMMRLIQLNDQKQALFEASPEFEEAYKRVVPSQEVRNNE